jgi:hypothetical protein
MKDPDFGWAAELMEKRRSIYEKYSPIFCRPAAGIADLHGQFLASVAKRPGSVALPSDHGFVLSSAAAGHCLVDDFAVEGNDYWPNEGRRLLLADWQVARSAEQGTLRVVTARLDQPQAGHAAGPRTLRGGKVVGKGADADRGSDSPRSNRARRTAGADDPAPPVYDPGGPVCLLGDVESEAVSELLSALRETDAVLAVVQREKAGEAPVEEPELERLGFHNPSEFYQGDPGSGV